MINKPDNPHARALATLARMEETLTFEERRPGSRSVAEDATCAYAVLRAVLELHVPFWIYDECGHDHIEGEPGVIDVPEVGLTCEEALIQTVCRECALDDGVVREDSCDHDWPCPTVCAFEALEGGDDA